jgi:hypothetical protein
MTIFEPINTTDNLGINSQLGANPIYLSYGTLTAGSKVTATTNSIAATIYYGQNLSNSMASGPAAFGAPIAGKKTWSEFWPNTVPAAGCCQEIEFVEGVQGGSVLSYFIHLVQDAHNPPVPPCPAQCLTYHPLRSLLPAVLKILLPDSIGPRKLHFPRSLFVPVLCFPVGIFPLTVIAVPGTVRSGKFIAINEQLVRGTAVGTPPSLGYDIQLPVSTKRTHVLIRAISRPFGRQRKKMVAEKVVKVAKNY